MDSSSAFYYVTAGGVKKLFNDKVNRFHPNPRPWELEWLMKIGFGLPRRRRLTPASAIHEHHDGDDVYRPSSKHHKTMAEIEELLIQPGLHPVASITPRVGLPPAVKKIRLGR